MKLSVKERLILLSILPREGSFTTLKVLRKLQDSLSFSEEEHKLYKFVQQESTVNWDSSAEQDKEIEFGEKALEIISSTLTDLSKKDKLLMEHFELYEKFVSDG